jgi:hypothetical protein
VPRRELHGSKSPAAPYSRTVMDTFAPVRLGVKSIFVATCKPTSAGQAAATIIPPGSATEPRLVRHFIVTARNTAHVDFAASSQSPLP